MAAWAWATAWGKPPRCLLRIASAASWDLNEAYKYGSVIGAEMRAYGMNVNLGGNINLIGREPRDGRTFETKGEDPILAGKITAAHINAIQAQHVIGGIKHYALNDQESGRTTANVEIDERGMRESDLLAFEIGVKDSNVQSVMCSYNLVNERVRLREPAPAERRSEGRLAVSGIRHVGLVGDAFDGGRGAGRPRSGAAGQRSISEAWRRRSPAARCRSRAWTTWCIASCAPCTRPDCSIIRNRWHADRYRRRPGHRAGGGGAGRGAAEERRRATSAERARP